MIDVTNFDMRSFPIDFTHLEHIDFYGNFGEIEPDRVYKNDEGETVAFISQEKCHQLKNILVQSTQKFYDDNRALLYSHGYQLGRLMKCDSFDGPSKGKKVLDGFKTFGKNLWSGFGLYSIVTNSIISANDKAGDTFSSMIKRAVTCNKVNATAKSGGNNYFCKKENSYVEGVELGFGKQRTIACPRLYLKEEDDEYGRPQTINKIIEELLVVENLFREGNRINSSWHKNIGSSLLTKINRIFHENFERGVKYDFSGTLTREKALIIIVRKYINYLVLSYRWMSVNINLYGCGNINCLRIASPSNQECYYLTRADTDMLANQMSMKVAVEINRYLGTFNIGEATNEFIVQCLQKNSIRNTELVSESNKIDEKIDNLEDELSEVINNMAQEASQSLTNSLIKGSSNAIEIPKCLNNSKTSTQFIGTIINKINKLEKRKIEVLEQLSESKDFREMFYLHLQLQFIKKYFNRYSAIIMTITTNGTDKKYDIQFLM
ncbi:hypothetical protein M9Y10_008517 [Tritrichomonas musculus]|uniref:Uncharacterized protein n=1 Tax=Tritrichomonas musculus TaxID=1915356 RepID=A0ABR2IZC1_9EUKA